MKSFNEKYRQLLSQDASSAPDDVWENISLQLDIDAAEMRLDAEDKQLIDEVWTDIEEQLDVDEVWGNISGELDKADTKISRFRLPYWVAAAAAVLLLLFLIGDDKLVPLLKNNNNKQYIADVQTEQDQSAVKPDLFPDSGIPLEETDNVLTDTNENSSAGSAIASSSDLNSGRRPEKSGTNAVKDINGYKSVNPVESTTGPFSKNLADNAIAVNETAPNRNTFRYPEGQPDLAVSRADNSYLAGRGATVSRQQDLKPKLKLELFDFEPTDGYIIEDLDFEFPINENYDLLAYNKTYSPWSTGIVTTIKNTYLLNAETKNGFSPSGMNASEITVLPDFGINVQYDINQRYTLSSNLFLSSSLKQNYHIYSYGEYVSKQSKLTYLAGELAIKQSAKYNFFDSDKVIRRNILGFYAGSLQSASETLANVKTDISSKYTALDYGVLLGQEFEFVSNGPIKVSAGLTAKYGLPNVYAGDNSLPGNLNHTHNTSIEFRVRIDYRWKSNKGFDNILSVLTIK